MLNYGTKYNYINTKTMKTVCIKLMLSLGEASPRTMIIIFLARSLLYTLQDVKLHDSI